MFLMILRKYSNKYLWHEILFRKSCDHLPSLFSSNLPISIWCDCNKSNLFVVNASGLLLLCMSWWLYMCSIGFCSGLAPCMMPGSVCAYLPLWCCSICHQALIVFVIFCPLHCQSTEDDSEKKVGQTKAHLVNS